MSDLLRVKLNSFEDLKRVVVFSNSNVNIHIIIKHKNKYSIYYGSTNECFWTEDDNGLPEGIYKYKDISLRNYKKIDYIDPEDHTQGNIYLFIVEAELDEINRKDK